VNVWRQVVAAVLRSVPGPDTSRRTRWWLLTLECEHKTERPVRYRALTPAQPQGTRRSADDVLPPPKTVSCPECTRGLLEGLIAERGIVLDSSQDTR
jgi:hypothetical protein